MGAAWQASISCQETTATYCPPFNAKREAIGTAVPCDYGYKTNQCSMANYVSATMVRYLLSATSRGEADQIQYDDSSDVKGNIVMSASSHVDSPGIFDCGSFLSAMSGAATAASLNPVIIGGTVIASVICGAAG